MSPVVASIAKSGPEIGNHCMEIPGTSLLAAAILNSGLEIKNRCTEVPEMILVAAVIVNSGPEIENHCSSIVPASRMARLRRCCRNGDASDSNFRCLKEE